MGTSRVHMERAWGSHIFHVGMTTFEPMAAWYILAGSCLFMAAWDPCNHNMVWKQCGFMGAWTRMSPAPLVLSKCPISLRVHSKVDVS